MSRAAVAAAALLTLFLRGAHLSMVLARFLPAPASPRLAPQRRLRTQRDAAAQADVETSLGNSEVRWLPGLDTKAPDAEPSAEAAAPASPLRVMPLFPLSTVGCVPHSIQEVSIFEPRYRKLYDDILVSGARQFVATAIHPEEEDRFAEVGVVFYLEDLRDVSEQSHDRVKYICRHKVTGRVRIRRVLNPAAWEDASTYLRVEVEPLEDGEEIGSTAEATTAAKEAALMDRLLELVDLQADLNVVQIMPEVSGWANASRAERGGLWSLAHLWADYFEYVIEEREHILDEDVDLKINAMYPEGPPWEDEAAADELMGEWRLRGGDSTLGHPEIHQPPRISYEEVGPNSDYEESDSEDENDVEPLYIDDLPPQARAAVQMLHRNHDEDVAAFRLRQTESIQLLLQATSHEERLALFKNMLDEEFGRLSMKQKLQSTVLESAGDR